MPANSEVKIQAAVMKKVAKKKNLKMAKFVAEMSQARKVRSNPGIESQLHSPSATY